MNQKRELSRFRLWVQNIWVENSEEHLYFRENPYTIQQYWEKYKYWLKREYKHQQGKRNG